MIWKIYAIIIGYYLLGTIGIYFIYRKKESEIKRKAWVKHISYLVVSSGIYFSMAVNPLVFRILAILILLVGFYELFDLYRKSGFKHQRMFLRSVCLLALLSPWFISFSLMDKGLLLYTFIILSIFDGFSQVTGQLIGKTKLFPGISPNKTVEGLIGGMLVAVLSALVFRDLLDAAPLKAILLAAVVAIFAFAGDLSKSFYKRSYQVKDFNNLIPGHGGFLDRFDSLIAGGTGAAIFIFLSAL